MQKCVCACVIHYSHGGGKWKEASGRGPGGRRETLRRERGKHGVWFKEKEFFSFRKSFSTLLQNISMTYPLLRGETLCSFLSKPVTSFMWKNYFPETCQQVKVVLRGNVHNILKQIEADWSRLKRSQSLCRHVEASPCWFYLLCCCSGSSSPSSSVQLELVPPHLHIMDFYFLNLWTILYAVSKVFLKWKVQKYVFMLVDLVVFAHFVYLHNTSSFICSSPHIRHKQHVVSVFGLIN